jgi:hypothetical protein
MNPLSGLSLCADISHLPTCVLSTWEVAALCESLCSELLDDKASRVLRMFFYAITVSGWQEIRDSVLAWKDRDHNRSVIVYVGTDHALTEPAALEMMQTEGIDLRIMEEYQGIYHPKVVWLEGEDVNIVWVGSNNLTKAGLRQNIEFAVLVRSSEIPVTLCKWAEEVHNASTQLKASDIKSYRNERKKYVEKQAEAKLSTFTWSKKKEPAIASQSGLTGEVLIMEITPKETGVNGNQIQVPLKAAIEYFGIGSSKGSVLSIDLSEPDGSHLRNLTMTVFGNSTVRLSVNELGYSDRPCLILFKKNGGTRVSFEIVSQSISPRRYISLLAKCHHRTRRGSRNWIIADLPVL